MLDNVEKMLLMAERSMYESRLQEVLREYPCRVSPHLTQLTDYLFLGSYQDAKNPEFLAEAGITHVLNCAAYKKSCKNPYPEWSGVIGYRQIDALDDDCYDIIQHVPATKSFIDGAKRNGGKVLVHCARGINRSAALCIAYLMVDSRQDLVETVKYVKRRRGLVLTNTGFRRQLIDFARKYGFLDSSNDETQSSANLCGLTDESYAMAPSQSQFHTPTNLNQMVFTDKNEKSESFVEKYQNMKRSNLNVVLNVPQT